MVECHAHGRDRQVVMVAEGVAEALGQIARSLVIDVGERSHAIRGASAAALQSRLDDPCTDEVANRLRPVLIAARLRAFVYFLGKVVVDGDGDALHGWLMSSRFAKYDLLRWTSYPAAA